MTKKFNEHRPTTHDRSPKLNSHFCPDFDGKIVDETMSEYQACSCPTDFFGNLKFDKRCSDPFCACNDGDFIDP